MRWITILSLICNLVLLAMYLLRTNSTMVLIAYMFRNGIPLPSKKEMRELCREAWKHMFTRV